MPALQAPSQKSYTWLLVASIFVAALIWACGDDDDSVAVDAGSVDSGAVMSSSSSSSGTLADAQASDSGLDAGADADADAGFFDAGPLPNPTVATEPTEANFKVAFLADTGTGNDFKSVLALIRRENADLVIFQGDLNYTFPSPSADWFAIVDNEINKTFPGSVAPVTIPYFAAKGNHDINWNPGYADGFTTRMAQWGIATSNATPAARNYSIVYKGLELVMVDESETVPSRADYVTTQLAADNHLWKICSWHKNQRNSNVGSKSDEMGWEIYERCRRYGAIVAQGHSHTYSRSKTLTNDAKLTIDATCSDPFDLCVGEGRHFFFDSSVGGMDVRPLNAVAAKPHFASSAVGSFGALFIEFNVGGDPKKAEGYFKTATDLVLDPPAASGKTKFTITRAP